MLNYIVQPGDTLSSIATRFNTSVEELARINGLTVDSDGVLAGLLLNVPDTSEQNGAQNSNNSYRSADEVKRSLETLAPEAKEDVASHAIRTLSDEARKVVTNETVATLSAKDKKDIASEAVQTLPIESKKDIANEAVQTLPTEAKKDMASKAIQDLPRADQEDLAEQFLPSQNTVDQIWQIIVWAFAVVFVLSALALFAAAFWRDGNIQILLTVVTTIAGVLAGFVSGRASSIARSNIPRSGPGGTTG